MESRLFFILAIFSLTNIISPATYTCNQNSACGCSASSTIVTSRIVGGELAPANAWNWMVSLSRGGSHRCGASLISASYAITAAHCVEGYVSTPSVFTVLAGTNYLYDTTSTTIQRRTVTNIIRHPNYNSATEENDIAILKFSALTISTDSKISFICLPALNVDPFTTNTNLIATGWGYTAENSYSVSEYLRQVTVQVFSSTSDDCIRGGIENSNLQFCAGVSGGGKDTCQGDSGGPLMAFVNNVWSLAGITSYGYGCARAGYPGIYTRVSAQISFITSNTDVNITTTTSSGFSTSSSSTARTSTTSNHASTNASIIEISHGDRIQHHHLMSSLMIRMS